jgi:hypothetical protein
MSGSLLTAGCLSPENEARVGRHFDLDPWGGAVVQTVEEPSQWAPVVALVVATPILHQHDRSYSEQMQESHSITGSSRRVGYALTGALAVASAGVAGWKWYEGDHAQSLEVAVESFALTGLEVAIMKNAVGRQRPDDGAHDSFPSGHAAFAFASSTFLARTIWATEEPGQGSFWTDATGWACYLPAALVAINRVESGSHFPSDVTAGAALGVLTTNLVWNAHYGDPGKEHESIFEPEHPVTVTVSPIVMEDGLGLMLQVRF